MHLASAPTVVEYCRGEILATCRNLQPGENRIHECLLARPTVSDACAAYLATVAPPPPPAPRLGFLFDVVDALFSAPMWAEQDGAPFEEVLEVPFAYDQVHGQQPYDDMEAMPAPRRFDAGGFAPPPRISRVEGHPSPRFEGVESLPLRGAGFGRGPLLNAGPLLDAEPPREVVVEVVEESVEEQEADTVSSLLLLVSAAALCLASLSLAGLALGAARRRAREREELLAFKANYAPMLAESA